MNAEAASAGEVAELASAVADYAAELLEVDDVKSQSDLLTLGFDSLGAHRMVGWLLSSRSISLGADVVLRAATPSSIASAALSAEPIDAGSVQPATSALSRQQIDLWMEGQLNPDNVLGHVIVFGYRLTPPARPARLMAATRGVVERHAALRTAIRTDNQGMPTPVVLSVNQAAQLAIEERDDGPLPNRRPVVAQIAQAVDVENGPILAMHIVSSSEWTDLFVAVHHTAFDGHSRALFLAEMSALVVRRALPPIRPAASRMPIQNRRRSVPEWWGKRLAAAKAIAWPGLPDSAGDRCGYLTVRLPEHVYRTIQMAARENGVTPFLFALRYFGRALQLVTGHPSFRVLVPTAGRDDPNTHHAIGYFVRPTVVPLSDAELFGPVDTIARTWETAVQFSDLSVSELIRTVRRHQMFTGPLHQVDFAWQNYPQAVWTSSSIEAKELTVAPLAPLTDLSVGVTPRADGGLQAEMTYDRHVVPESVISAMRRTLINEDIVAEGARE